MSERRTHSRFDVCLDVRWQASAIHRNVRVADLSEGGCYVDTIMEATKGEHLDLQIRMPDGEWFEVQGVVTHHFPQLGFGVRFVNLTEEHNRRIRGVIRQFSSGQETQTEPAWHVETIEISSHKVM